MASSQTVHEAILAIRADTAQLRQDLSQAQNVMRSGLAGLEGLISSFTPVLSIAGIAAFAKSIIDLGGRLQDLSVQTGISVQTLSGIKSVVEENGTSLDAFANGIFRLQKELGTIKDDTDPAAQAIKALGLNLKELQGASPEQALTLITDALAKQENVTNRNALAFALLGKSSRELVPAVIELAGKIDDLRKKGLTPEDVKTLDDFGDSITRLSNNAKLFVATDLAGAFRELQKVLDAIVPVLPELPKGLDDALQSFTSLTRGIQNTEREIFGLHQALLKLLLGFTQLGEGLPEFGFQKRLREQVVPYLKEQLKEIQDLMGEIGQPTSHTPVPEVTKTPFTPPIDTAAIKRATDATEQFIASLQKQADAVRVSIVELDGGGLAAKSLGLDAEFAAFKAKALVDNLKLPPDIQQRFEALKQTILGLTFELTKAKEVSDRLAIDERDAAATRKAFEDAALAPFKAEDALTQQRLDEAAARGAQDFDEMAQATRDWNAQGAKAADIGDDLTRAFSRISDEAKVFGDSFDTTAAKIDAVRETLKKLMDAGITSGPEFDFQKQLFGQLQGVKEAEDFGKDIANSLTQGITNTLEGIETGQQSLSEGMKNLARNMALELQFALLDKAVLEPVKAGIEGFVTGLIGSFDDSLKKQMEQWGKQAGEWLNSLITDLFQGIGGGAGGGGAGGAAGSSALSGIASWISSLFTFEQGGLIPGFATGGRIPSFDSGGLFMGHPGEFVLKKASVDKIGLPAVASMNATGKMPEQGGGGSPKVIINGDITPRQPGMTREQVVQIVTSDFHNQGPAFQMFEQRTNLKRG